MLGLEDLRFEVRYQCGQSLLAIVEKNPAVRIDRARVFALVHKEVAVSKDVWEKRRLLDTTGEGDHLSFLEELVRDRANQSLAHVFTLLALVLPTNRCASRFGPCTPTIRAYGAPPWSTLETTLPHDIRDRLWRFLEDPRPPGTVPRPDEQALADLLRSHESIRINLDDLKKRGS